MLEEYNKLKDNNNDKIVFIKRGHFYYTYFKDSYIISYIFNYKYVCGKVSFPITNKINVCNKLNKLNIGYIIDNEIIYGDSEVYNDYLANGYNKVKYDILIEDINNILIKLDINKLVYKLININNFNIKYNIFYIKDPKYRIIMSMNISDKIINHYIAKYILLPKINKYLDIRNVASRKNMGYSYAIKLLNRYIELNKKYKDIYVLKIDISKYFYSIDHNILKELLKGKLDTEEYSIISTIIDSTNYSYINDTIINIKNKLINIDKKRSKEINDIPLYEYNKGLSIGSVVNQILSIFYLYKLDHYIIHNLHIKYYIRYVDDFILIYHDKEYLKYVYRVIENKLNKEYKLKLNKNKCMIVNIKHGFIFLGSRYRVINNKTIVSISSNKKRRIRRNIKKKKNLYSKGYISYKSYYSSINSYGKFNI